MNWQVMHSMTKDSSVAERRLAPGTRRRVLQYARPYRRQIGWFLLLVVLDAMLVVAVPLLFKSIIDDGVIPQDSGVVVRLSLVVAVIALVEGALTLVQRWFSARIGEGLIYDLRTEVFGARAADARWRSSPAPRRAPSCRDSTTTSSAPSRRSPRRSPTS